MQAAEVQVHHQILILILFQIPALILILVLTLTLTSDCDEAYEEVCSYNADTKKAVWTVCDDIGVPINYSLSSVSDNLAIPFTCPTNECAPAPFSQESKGCTCKGDSDCPPGYQFCSPQNGVCVNYSSVFTVDIGGNRLKDADDNNIDPSDLYQEIVIIPLALPKGPEKIFDDALLFLPSVALAVDPPPVPERTNPDPWDTVNINGNLPVNNLDIDGIQKKAPYDYRYSTNMKPDRFGIYYSLDDDQADPWQFSSDGSVFDIPRMVTPDHPKQWWENYKVLDGEINFSLVSRKWTGTPRVLPVRFEAHMIPVKKVLLNIF